MFLQRIRLFDKGLIFQTVKFSRLISQTSSIQPEFHSTNDERPCKLSHSKQAQSLSHATTASMKLPVFKRLPRKKPVWKNVDNSKQYEGQYYNLSAYATADWYDLDRLKERLTSLSKPFQTIHISDLIEDVLCVQINRESKQKGEAFIFDDGAVIFWNVQSDDEKLLLKQIDEVSDNQYPKDVIDNEKEVMNFVEVSTASTLYDDIIRLNRQSETEQLLDKYTFSNALALSVKLGIWEALLDNEVEFVADLANRLKQGQHIKIQRGLMQRKSGELYSLKHAVNLSHDFLDTPDFYWSNSRLENLYKRVFNYFTIAKRTRVLNERLNFSLELIQVIEGSLSEKKHVRLEWIIIMLIFVEVFFNIVDHVDFSTWKILSKHAKTSDDLH